MFPFRLALSIALVTLVCVSLIVSARAGQTEFRGVRLLPQADVTAVQADSVADAVAAVNTRFCQRSANYTSFADPADATVRYLVQAGFRHIRDGGIMCEGDRAFQTFSDGLFHSHGIDMLSDIEPCASDAQIRRLFVEYPSTRAVEGPNEYDNSKPIQFAISALPSSTQRIRVSAETRYSFTIGQSYQFGEGPSQEPVKVLGCPDARWIALESPLRYAHAAGSATSLAETVPAGSTSFDVRDATSIHGGDWVSLDCTGHSLKREALQVDRVEGSNVSIQSPTRSAHNRGAPVARSCLVNDKSYVSDLLLLYRRMASIIKADPKTASIPILADSQAQQADNDAFAGSGIDRFEDIGNVHDYPLQRNPGGEDGTGTKGFGGEFVGCGPYGAYWYNMCAQSLQFKFTENRRSVKPVWTTEVSYNVAPVGGPWNSLQHPIPDDVAVKYLPRLELYYLGNAHARVYWFELVDSASGCGNVFGQFGLVRRDCASGSLTPKPEYYALADMISLFGDPGCRVPTCSFRPGSLKVSTAATDPSLQFHLSEKHDGTYLLAFWLERPGYDADSTQPCRQDLSCYVRVSPVKTTFAITGGGSFGHPSLRTFETQPSAPRFGHLTPPMPTSIDASGQWTGNATDTVQILSWRGTPR